MLPAAPAANSLSACPELLQPKQLHHLHLTLTQVLQLSLRSKPQWKTHAEMGKETLVETQRQCESWERPKTFPPAE